MPNAIEVLDSRNLTIGHAGFGIRGENVGSVAQQVHDGDTISVRAIGNVGVRLLGIDTPEISFRLPGQNRFLSLSNSKWTENLTDPFAAGLPDFDTPLSAGLAAHLKSRCGPATAENHYRFAKLAEDRFEDEIRRDLEIMGTSLEDFRFFLAFAFEIMDGYGRFLCYINREQPNPNVPERRPLTYNERLLQQAAAVPYFIWPNVNPFRRAKTKMEAVPQPGTARSVADAESTLSRAREWMASARSEHRGIYEAMQPLLLEPFELRLLARREAPRRWVIDLSRNDDLLLHPHSYHRVPHPEDRLFIPEEYVPLFVEAGWKRGMPE